MTTTISATLPAFSSPGFTKDGESSVLGSANARSLRIYDWTYQYADHERGRGPLVFLVPLGLPLRPPVPPRLPISL